MTSLSQNLGALDNNQSTDGFSPGAQAVDLRGLGSNHTLVLVNGRRIADYPQAYGGNKQLHRYLQPADVADRARGNPERQCLRDLRLRCDVGRDQLHPEKKVDGTTFDYRIGDTEHGGGSSHRLQISSGFSTDRFDAVFGLELIDAKPIWDYQRSYTDSRLDSPAAPNVTAGHTFVRQDVNGNYLDPGQATCDSLSHLNEGTVFYASRRGYAPDNEGGPGYFCGSYRDVAYGTLQNGRKAANFFGSGTFHFNDHLDLFLDVLAGTSHQESYNTSLKWQNCEKLNGDCSPTPFYNAATGQIEQWERNYFTLEENGGLKPGNPQRQQDGVADHRHQRQLRSGRPMGLRGLVRLLPERAHKQVARADRGQGAGLVPGTVARCRSGQRLPDLQRAGQPLLHAADSGRVPFDHPGLDRQRHESRQELVSHAQQLPRCSICRRARSVSPQWPSTAISISA